MALKKIPSKVQLPGSIVLQAIPFKIIELHDDGSPKMFEIMPRGTETAEFWLFADENQVRGKIKRSS